MAEQASFTCVSCPIGCVLEVQLNDAHEVEKVTGHGCNRGLDYAKQEAVDPRRNISAVVMVAGALEPLSVKTAEPIPKNRIFDVMEEIRALRLQAPVQAGQVLIEDAAETGISIIATKSI